MSVTRQRGFGPDQVVDLDRYKGRWTNEECERHTKRGRFLGFRFLDLAKYGGDYLHEELLNIAIRAEGNKDNADHVIAASYKKIGWSYDPFPPIVDLKGIVKDGRTRIRAAIIAGEKFIAVAVFEYPDEEDDDTAYVHSLSEGLIGNDDLVSRPTKYKDLLEAGIAATTTGNIPHEKSAITELVFNEFEAERFIDVGEIPTLVEEIYEAVSGGQEAIWNVDREDVLKYLRNSPDLPKDACLDGDVCVGGKRVFVYAAPSNTNQGRLWAKLASQIPEESYIVLYTTKKIPSKIKKGYDEFMEYVDWRYKECFEIVNRTLNPNSDECNITIKAPKSRPWKVLGVIPQLNKDETHVSYRNMNKLIKLEDYC